MQIQKLQENDLELFYKYAKEEQWDIEDIPDSFAFLFAYKDGYKITIKTQEIMGSLSFLHCVKTMRVTLLSICSQLCKSLYLKLLFRLSLSQKYHTKQECIIKF